MAADGLPAAREASVNPRVFSGPCLDYTYYDAIDQTSHVAKPRVGVGEKPFCTVYPTLCSIHLIPFLACAFCLLSNISNVQSFCEVSSAISWLLKFIFQWLPENDGLPSSNLCEGTVRDGWSQGLSLRSGQMWLEYTGRRAAHLSGQTSVSRLLYVTQSQLQPSGLNWMQTDFFIPKTWATVSGPKWNLHSCKGVGIITLGS